MAVDDQEDHHARWNCRPFCIGLENGSAGSMSIAICRDQVTEQSLHADMHGHVKDVADDVRIHRDEKHQVRNQKERRQHVLR